MKIVIDIPKEFEDHFGNDRFKDSLSRVLYDARKNAEETQFSGLSGLYEIETLEMLIPALQCSTPLPERLGDLIERDAIYNKLTRMYRADEKDYPENGRNYRTGLSNAIDLLNHAQIIIEADKEERGWEK